MKKLEEKTLKKKLKIGIVCLVHKTGSTKRKEVVLEPGDDLRHLRANVFQEGGTDENPKTT